LWGGLLAYFALAMFVVLLAGARRPAALDLVALTIPIPWIAAKLGCFFNGCCYGRPCSLPWAVTFPPGARTAPPGVPVHPSQLYEVGLMLIILLVFSQLKSDRWQGTKLLWFLAIYGVGRAATDFLRGDTEGPLYLGVLSLTQVLSLAAGAAALILLLAHARKANCGVRSPKEA
jgi:phosphatidylglycerol:prolipoprotein diacylglycerol transferase